MSGISGGGAVDDFDSVGKQSWRAAVDTVASSPASKKIGRPRRYWRRKIRARLRDWYHRYVIELVLRQQPLPPSKDGRHIPLRLDGKKPLIDERRGHPYVSNAIRTSRYTVYDFFPKQLIFQFTRVSNFYFLCVGVPQTIPGVSTTGSFTTILPLLFFVLLTVVKEGYDDWRRHRLDKIENARSATVLRDADDVQVQNGSWTAWFSRVLERRTLLLPWVRGRKDSAQTCEEASVTGLRWTTTRWKDLKVGDVIKLTRDEDVPADFVLLYADGENGLAYVDTMALDGETNLKSKQVSKAIKSCDSIEGIARCHAAFVVEDPNQDLYRFDGRVTVDGETLPLTLNEVVYRGCTLRNTAYVVGIVINTGEECKIRRNADRHPKAKKPALERMSNKVVVSLAFYVVMLSVGCSIGYLLWQKAYEEHAWYLVNAAVPFAEIIIGLAIQFNNVIPLALYVSLEIVKLGQMAMLNFDIEMYDEVSDTPARCNTNTILEDLGQIGFVFSDKTGTLTENVMKFRKMSVAGTSWLHEMDMDDNNNDNGGRGDAESTDTATKSESPEQELLASRSEEGINSSGVKVIVSPAPPPPHIVHQPSSSSHWQSTGRPDHVQPELNTRDLLEYIRSRPNSAFARKVVQYILAMALCHTCLPEVKEDGKIEFQAASPDEIALVTAAQDLGFLLVQRSSQSVTLREIDGDGNETEQVYEILDVIEFSSKRKRMTIIVRCPDGRIWLLMKGADSAILPRLRMAPLAMQKANELRESAEVEHELQRKSEAREPRNSFGGRPSLTVRRSTGGRLSNTVAGPSKRPSGPIRSVSFEASRLFRRSEEEWGRPPHLSGSQTVSFDLKRMVSLSPSPAAELSSPFTLPHKFSFLDDAARYDDGEVFTRCFKHIDDFASEGLRTLLFAHKFLTEQEYRAWKKLYHDAETSLADRQERIEAVGDVIEQSLDLIGASAIEDKLQKGVPETIERLRKANIKIWMLTGDKRETAINIAHSARICRPGSDIYVLDIAKGGLEAQVLGIIEELQVQRETEESAANTAPNNNHTVVVIDGHSLGAIEEPGAVKLRRLFYSLIPTIDSVICCRASPAQKALLVQAIRKSAVTQSAWKAANMNSNGSASSTSYFPRISFPATGPLTLAIGDGANDLAMLSAAHVGVGISGREGLQAARVADYSVAQFRFLARLLLVHGRWNYVRTARFILATFWKEMFFYLPTELYQRYNGYTGTSLYESWSLTVLNTLFTSLCVIVPGIWEQDLAATTLLAVPELYVFGQRDKGLNLHKYLVWMVGAVSEGLLVWFLCWALYGGLWPAAIRDNGLFALGNLVFSVAIMWTNLKLMILDTRHKTAIVLGSCLVTVAGWWAWQGFLSGAYGTGVSPYAVRGGLAGTFGPDPYWWLTLLAVLLLLGSLELCYRAVKRALLVSGLWKFGRRWLAWRTWRRALVVGGTARRNHGPADADAGRGVEEWDVELWQEMEQDPAVRKMLGRMSRLDGGGGDAARKEEEEETNDNEEEEGV